MPSAMSAVTNIPPPLFSPHIALYLPCDTYHRMLWKDMTKSRRRNKARSSMDKVGPDKAVGSLHESASLSVAPSIKQRCPPLSCFGLRVWLRDDQIGASARLV